MVISKEIRFFCKNNKCDDLLDWCDDQSTQRPDVFVRACEMIFIADTQKCDDFCKTSVMTCKILVVIELKNVMIFERQV